MHAVIVLVHPSGVSLTLSVATGLVEALEAKGHTSEIADLVAERFDPVFGAADHARFSARGPLPADVANEQLRLDRADHLILVYPVYWWSMPGLLKGWIDRVFISGWAFDEDTQGRIVKRLGRLKVHLVAIAGASSATYTKRGYRDAMRTQIEEGIFDFCGAPVISSQVLTCDIAYPASVPLHAAHSLMQRLG